MDELATSTVRSRGRFWLANRPHRMLAWDAVAGAVSVEDVGPWPGIRSSVTVTSTSSSPAPTSIRPASTPCSTPACSPRRNRRQARTPGPTTTTRSPPSSP
ncbi:GTP-binding protein [Nonomuraea deserti]|uniref:GTP-binding protein n=1 Tax=Nonomuraea deserti TaxID=1848322 RepID=UPI00319DA114